MMLLNDRSTGSTLHWGEKLAQPDSAALIDHTAELLANGSGTGSFSLDTAHGGTNFGFNAGPLFCSPIFEDTSALRLEFRPH